ncbi:hypothetical protein BDC45DRAFT_525238, partial [Circinella umbellata]
SFFFVAMSTNTIFKQWYLCYTHHILFTYVLFTILKLFRSFGCQTYKKKEI